MRRIAILIISLLAVFPAFGQTAPGRGASGASGANKVPRAKSKAEAEAVTAMGKATDPDAQIKAAEDLLIQYPNTEFKGTALLMEAEAYHTKRDDTKSLAMAEQSLDADPNMFETLLLISEILSGPGSHSTDLDIQDKLAKSDKYANEALELLASSPKPNPQLSDAEWEQAKKGEEARGWASLGFSALLRNKFPDATTDFQKSVDLQPNAVTMLYIDRAYLAAKRYDDAIAWTDKAVAASNGNAQIDKYATSDKTRAEALKKQSQ